MNEKKKKTFNSNKLQWTWITIKAAIVALNDPIAIDKEQNLKVNQINKKTIMSLDIDNETRTLTPHRLNKKFR